jgi:hypothetical protein
VFRTTSPGCVTAEKRARVNVMAAVVEVIWKGSAG